jgi:exosortase/archaeosortase family protein
MTAIPDTTGLNALHGRQARLGPSRSRVALRIAALLALLGALFVVGQAPFRHWEAYLVAEAVRVFGFHGVLGVHDSQILISGGGQVFWVDITPSCSSLGPALALALIATVMSAGSPASDRVLAVLAGVASIVVGNLVRIGASVVAGLLAGRVSLVLFHDWVGSTFGFAYTVGGFVLVLAILLRRKRRRIGLGLRPRRGIGLGLRPRRGEGS